VRWSVTSARLGAKCRRLPQPAWRSLRLAIVSFQKDRLLETRLISRIGPCLPVALPLSVDVTCRPPCQVQRADATSSEGTVSCIDSTSRARFWPLHSQTGRHHRSLQAFRAPEKRASMQAAAWFARCVLRPATCCRCWDVHLEPVSRTQRRLEREKDLSIRPVLLPRLSGLQKQSLMDAARSCNPLCPLRACSEQAAPLLTLPQFAGMRLVIHADTANNINRCPNRPLICPAFGSRPWNSSFSWA
jgi:hypothetical protein